MDYKLTKYEKETSINMNDLDHTAEMYTCQSKMIKKLDKLCSKYPDDFKCIDQDEYSKTYRFDKKYVSVRAPRVISDEHKEKLRNATKKARMNNQKFVD
jgi:hypothetical protein